MCVTKLSFKVNTISESDSKEWMFAVLLQISCAKVDGSPQSRLSWATSDGYLRQSEQCGMIVDGLLSRCWESWIRLENLNESGRSKSTAVARSNRNRYLFKLDPCFNRNFNGSKKNFLLWNSTKAPKKLRTIV